MKGHCIRPPTISGSKFDLSSCPRRFEESILRVWKTFYKLSATPNHNRPSGVTALLAAKPDVERCAPSLNCHTQSRSSHAKHNPCEQQSNEQGMLPTLRFFPCESDPPLLRFAASAESTATCLISGGAMDIRQSAYRRREKCCQRTKKKLNEGEAEGPR